MFYHRTDILKLVICTPSYAAMSNNNALLAKQSMVLIQIRQLSHIALGSIALNSSISLMLQSTNIFAGLLDSSTKISFKVVL